jgi:hypothetical protein
MKIYHDIIQGTEDWFKLKYGKVGGSTSKGLFTPTDTLLLELLAEHTEPFEMDEDKYVSKDMQRGIELEPLHRLQIENYTGVKFNVPGWMLSDLCPLIGVSPDGISECQTVSWEGKSPAAKRHIQTVYSKEIPTDNIHQCLHYFTVNEKLQTHYFSSFRPESKYPLWVKKLTRDSLIDLGTKANPKVKKISEWVGIATHNALELEANLSIALANLDKI